MSSDFFKDNPDMFLTDEPNGMCMSEYLSTPSHVVCWKAYDELECVLSPAGLVWVDDMDEDDCDQFLGP